MTTVEYRLIPEYDGRYLISANGDVCNSDGHHIKPFDSKDGPRVELRHLGQRDRPLIQDLINQVWGDQNELEKHI